MANFEVKGMVLHCREKFRVIRDTSNEDVHSLFDVWSACSVVQTVKKKLISFDLMK